MHFSLRAAQAAVPLLLGAALAAQGATSSTLAPITVPVHTAAADGDAVYGLWAAGHRYKASFHDGMTFVPYLGAEYPRNATFAWRTLSVRAGEQELVQHPGAPRTSDWRVEYDLGGVVEAYDVRAEGLEQTFVLRQRPAEGALVVRGAVIGPLAAARAEARHQDLVFFDAEGRAILTYGAATAIDANGDRQPMATSFDGAHVELHLDAAWLAGAAFPVVVDPLLTPRTLVVGADVVGMDVVHENVSGQDRLWVAYGRAVSASDTDLYLRRAEDDGLNHTLVYQDVSANWSTLEPSATYVRRPDCVLIAFTREFVGNGSRGVRWHRHDRDDSTLSTTFGSVSTPSGTHLWRPDVGGARYSNAGDQVLLVMQREDIAGSFANTTTSAVYACLLDMSGSGSAGAQFVIGDQVLTEYERPSVNQFHDESTGAAYWLVGYQVASTIGLGQNATWDVAVRKVSGDGTVTAPLVISAGSTDQRHEFAPQVAGSVGRYLVTMVASTLAQQPVRPSGPNGHSVRTCIVEWPAAAAAGVQPYSLEIVNSNVDARVELVGAAQDLDGNTHWGIAYRSNVTQSVYFATIGYTGNPIESATAHSGSATAPTIAGGVTFDTVNNTFVIGYGENGAGGSAGAVTVGRFQLGVTPPVTVAGIACSPASIYWYGTTRIGSGNGRVVVQGAPAGALQVALVGYQVASQPLVSIPGVQSGCWLLVPNTGAGHLGILPLQVGGTVAWDLPLPEWLDPLDLYFQGFHSDAAMTNFLSTQRLNVPVRF